MKVLKDGSDRYDLSQIKPGNVVRIYPQTIPGEEVWSENVLAPGKTTPVTATISAIDPQVYKGKLLSINADFCPGYPPLRDVSKRVHAEWFVMLYDSGHCHIFSSANQRQIHFVDGYQPHSLWELIE